MMNKRALLIPGLLFLLALAVEARGQGEEDLDEAGPEFVMPDGGDEPEGPNLRAKGRYYGTDTRADSIVIRWAAMSYPAWQTANYGGYIVERIDVAEAETDGEWKQLNTAPIKPLTIDEWKKEYGPADSLAGAAVQTLYGKAIAAETDPFGAIYETHLQQRNLHGFGMLLADVAPRLADGMGLRFVDRTAEPGRAYVYRIRSLTTDADIEIDTAVAVVRTLGAEPVPTIETLRAEEAEKQVVLKWARYETIRPFTGYYVEQSTDGGTTFSRLKEIPFIPANNSALADSEEGTFDTISYRIELEENYKPITYRVVGVDAFGDTSPGGAVVTAMGRDMTPPAAPIVRPITVVDNGFRIDWKPGTEEGMQQTKDLAGFYVGRSGDPEGPFEAISEFLPPTTATFTHEGVDTLLPGYYVVGAVDTAGNLQNSVALFGILPDSIAPATPIGLRGEIDSNGVVTLQWLPNAERDLQGYRVFFTNQADHEFQQLTTGIFTDTVWRDTLTLTTLTEEIFFRVTAFDQNFNHAPFTEILTLKKPDTIRPVAPVVVGIDPTPDGIAVSWYRSPSGDVLTHDLMRRERGTEEWEQIVSSDDPSLTTYIDRAVRSGIRYEYALASNDDDGNRSDLSNIVTARPFESGLRPAPENLSVLVDDETGAIRIGWSMPEGVDGRVEIFRTIGDGRPGLIASVDGELGSYDDSGIPSGTAVRYRLRLATDDGAESLFAESPIVRR